MKRWMTVLLCFAFYVTAQAKNNENIKVLIIDGYSNHDWAKTTQVIKSVLLHSGFCEVHVSTAPKNDDQAYLEWNPDFFLYDVVVQNVNNLRNGYTWPEQVKKNFESYMKQGGGMYVFHSANNSFPNWDEYNRMIGLGWRDADRGDAVEIVDGKTIRIPAGIGEATSHGKRLDLLVNILTNHPINKNFPKQWKAADVELYTYARGPAVNLQVLSYAYDVKTSKNWPIDWVVHYRKGRIYNATFGHLWHDQEMPPSIQCIGFQTSFLRAIQWLARKKVNVKVPDDFPTEDEISLKSVVLE